MPIQARIKPALSDQLLMITILGDAPTVEHQHSIGLFHRREAMGDDQGGAVAEEPIQTLMQGVLGRGIEGRGRFIQITTLGSASTMRATASRCR